MTGIARGLPGLAAQSMRTSEPSPRTVVTFRVVPTATAFRIVPSMTAHVHSSVDVPETVERVSEVLGREGSAGAGGAIGLRIAIRHETVEMIQGFVLSPPYGRIWRTISVERLQRGTRIHWDSRAELEGPPRDRTRVLKAEAQIARDTLRRIKRYVRGAHPEPTVAQSQVTQMRPRLPLEGSFGL